MSLGTSADLPVGSDKLVLIGLRHNNSKLCNDEAVVDRQSSWAVQVRSVRTWPEGRTTSSKPGLKDKSVAHLHGGTEVPARGDELTVARSLPSK